MFDIVLVNKFNGELFEEEGVVKKFDTLEGCVKYYKENELGKCGYEVKVEVH